MNKILPLLTFSAILFLYGCAAEQEFQFTGSGTFEAQDIVISAQTEGEIVNVYFDEGDSVAKGEILAQIDVEGLKLQRDVTEAGLSEMDWNKKIVDHEIAAARESVKQTTAALENIRTTQNRLENLFSQGASTRDRLDKVKTEFTVSSSQLKAAENRMEGLRAKSGSFDASREKINASLRLLDYRITKGAVVSTSDGIIIEKFIEQGELAVPGKPIFSIADLSTMRLTIYVSEEMLGTVKIGSKAKIYVDSFPEKTFEGTVSWISSEAEFTPKNVQTRESRVELVYAVRISADNNEGIFKIGMPADAIIEGL